MRNNYISFQWICCMFDGLNASQRQQIFLRLPQLFLTTHIHSSSLLLPCDALSSQVPSASAWPFCLSKDLHVLRLVCSCSLAGWGQPRCVLQGLSLPLFSSSTGACSPRCFYKTSAMDSRLLPFRLV